MDSINITRSEEYDKLRAEWGSSLVRTMASMNLGKVCFNCGCDEAIELHHIVPLRCGGTNNLSNIVVLCHRCHMAVHYGQHIKNYTNSVEKNGRPHNVDEKILREALEDYLNCKIGTKECKKRIKMGKKTKIGDMSFYKKMLKERGITYFRNNIDIILNKRGKICEGEVAGRMEFANGDALEIHYWGI